MEKPIQNLTNYVSAYVVRFEQTKFGDLVEANAVTREPAEARPDAEEAEVTEVVGGDSFFGKVTVADAATRAALEKNADSSDGTKFKFSEGEDGETVVGLLA